MFYEIILCGFASSIDFVNRLLAVNEVGCVFQKWVLVETIEKVMQHSRRVIFRSL